jgi:hypothetical protein
LAVKAELEYDGWRYDATKIMGSDFHYNPFTIPLFLGNVRNRLRSAGFNFRLSTFPANAALSMAVAQLEGAIDRATV